MDSYREHPGDFEQPAAEAAPADDIASAIGTDERRMHVRAYNYWYSLLEGRDYPSIEDLEPCDVEDFADHSVLLDFTAGRENPATPYIGTAIREECALDDGIRTISDVPSRSLLSRLTDHYMQIIANRAPVGFEAEFVNQRGVSICYRGILMPFSSDGDTIDFIYGVINWKASAQSKPGSEPVAAVEIPQIAGIEESAITGPEPLAPSAAGDDGAPIDGPHLAWEDGPLADGDPNVEDEEAPRADLDDRAGLADWLCAAREMAEAAKSADHRSRGALYRALSQAYDFAIAASRAPDDYSELLEESGVKAQARAPMTPIVKLVFGIDYDKARLTEFAAALSLAQRQALGTGQFLDLIQKQPGGLKALVAAERQARRPQANPHSRAEAARARLRKASTVPLEALPSEEEFCVVVTRRSESGGHEVVAVVTDEALVERAIRRAS